KPRTAIGSGAAPQPEHNATSTRIQSFQHELTDAIGAGVQSPSLSRRNALQPSRFGHFYEGCFTLQPAPGCLAWTTIGILDSIVTSLTSGGRQYRVQRAFTPVGHGNAYHLR